jgi:hypothetical protein
MSSRQMAYAGVKQCTGEHRELDQRRTAGATRIDVDVVARQDIQEGNALQRIGRDGGDDTKASRRWVP